MITKQSTFRQRGYKFNSNPENIIIVYSSDPAPTNPASPEEVPVLVWDNTVTQTTTVTDNTPPPAALGVEHGA